MRSSSTPKDDESIEDLIENGEVTLWLEYESRRWVLRRYERIECLDSWTILRTTTLDIDIPPDLIPVIPTHNGSVLLPLKTLSRGSNLLVTVKDYKGAHLPHYSREEERRLVAAGLVARAPVELEGMTPASKRELVLHTAAAIDSDDLAAPDNLNTRADSSRSIAQTGMDRVETPTGPLPSMDPSDIESQAENDLQQTLLWRYVVGEYQARWFVVGVFPTSAVQQGRGVRTRTTVSHPEGHKGSSRSRCASFRRLRSDHWRKITVPHSWKAGRRVRRSLLLVGSTIDTYSVEYDVNQLTSCRSFHVEFVAPPGTYVHKARIEGSVIGTDGEVVDKLDLDQSDPYPDRAHVYVQTKTTWRGVGYKSRLKVVMRPTTAGGMRGGLVTSWLTTVLLITMMSALVTPVGGVTPLLSMDLSPSVEALVTILMVGPALLSALVVRQGEHAVAKSVLYRFRGRTILQGILSAGAALMIGVGTSGRIFVWGFVAVTLASFGLSLWSSLSYYASWQWLKNGLESADS